MTRSAGPALRIVAPLAAGVLWAAPALATQGHGAPEGILVHQFAHLFFILSMGILCYWLNKTGLTHRKGWRRIQYAAFFFILWNIDAFLVHALEEQLAVVSVQRISPWWIRIRTAAGADWVAGVYYVAKLDHLLCVPALGFLYAGLRRLLADSAAPHDEGGAR